MAECASFVRSCLMRATLVDGCGRPIESDCSQITSKGHISVGYTAVLEEAEEILQKNACGEICILDTTCPELKRYEVEIEMCEVDPELFSMMTGQDLVRDWKGEAVGIQVGQKIECQTGFALETWTKVSGDDCDGGECYGYFLLPRVVNGILGDFTLENDAVTFTISGETRTPHKWGEGPHDVVVLDVDGTAGPLLEPVGSDKHLHMQKTCVAPPEAKCGCQSLNVKDQLVSCTTTVALTTAPTNVGDDAVITVTVTNPNDVDINITSLTINDGVRGSNLLTGTGSLNPVTSCTPTDLTDLAPGATYTCSVTLQDIGVAEARTLTVSAGIENADYPSATNSCTATVALPASTDLPCTVEINDAEVESPVVEGREVCFIATATDPEDGDIEDSVVWSSSLDGVIGAGTPLFYDDLSVGTHTITATATDSEGVDCTDTVQVVVTAAP